MKLLRKGQKVRVYNHDVLGKRIVEGVADVVKRRVELGEGWYRVRFKEPCIEYVDRNLLDADIL